MAFDKLINHLKLDKEEFIFQFNSHPNYPSALAFSDTLNFMGVKNDAYELDKEYWDELPDEFIAIVEDSFSLVKKSGANYSIYSDKTKTLNREDLHKKSADFILLFEKGENADHKSISSFKPFLYVAVGLILIYSFLNHTWYEIIFNILSLTGAYISLEIFNQKFGSVSTVIGSICGDNLSQQTVSSCDKIINQDKTSILGLKFSDFSLIYFIGISIMGLFLPNTSYLIQILAFASVIAIGYSLYIQSFVEKTFCRVCLLIISVLIAQLLISSFLFDNHFPETKTVLLTIILWIFIFASILFISNALKEKETLKKSNAKNLRFKRNYDLFKRELIDNERVIFNDNQTFSLGNSDAKLRLSIVSNPYCGFCKDAHKIAENLLEKYPNDLSIQMRFNYSPEKAEEKYTELISNFIYVYKNKTEKEFLQTVEYWFETKDESKIKAMAGKDIQQNLSPLIEMSRQNIEAGLSFTPVFIINGYLFPDKYDREDIYYFIDELIEDEEI